MHPVLKNMLQTAALGSAHVEEFVYRSVSMQKAYAPSEPSMCQYDRLFALMSGMRQLGDGLVTHVSGGLDEDVHGNGLALDGDNVSSGSLAIATVPTVPSEPEQARRQGHAATTS